jgi:hypothetical protein
MQIPILAGIYVDGSPVVRVAYPVNMVPVPGQDSTADGFLRPAEGVESFATGIGPDRGAILWNGVHYRVSGNALISVSETGTVVNLGPISGSGPVRMDYSLDRIGIAADGLLYYWDGTLLTTVTDPNIGTVNDVVWVDGYWMATDGTNIVVTTLTDPTTVNPLKYGSTDAPDTIQCLLKVQDQVNVVSRFEIDVFQNIGGAFFPFNSVPTAVMTKGAVGTRAACVFSDTVAFVGGGRNPTPEAPCVYQAKNAQFVKISSIEIDILLLSYTDAQLSAIVMETVFYQGGEYIFIHLPDRTVVYDAIASAVAQQPVWHIRMTGVSGFSQYRAINFLLQNSVMFVGDPLSGVIGTLSSSDSSHWGMPVRWEFATPMLRNGGKGAIINQLELCQLPGSPVGAGLEPMVSTSYSVDGVTWSQDRFIKSGAQGDRTKRLLWLKQGLWRNFRIQRFRGDSGSRLSAIRLDAEIETLAY